MNQPYPNPHPAAPRKKRRWPWVVGGLVVLGIIGSALGGNDEPAPAPVPSAAGAAVPAVVAPAPAPAVVAPAPVVAAPVAPAPAPVAPPAPVVPQMTVSQANALESAESYLDFTGFSRSGLIKQLEFEGYSTADATFAVDTVTVDWAEQAARSAKSYMDFSSFSRSGLINQLEFEGYTTEQAEYGADSVGL